MVVFWPNLHRRPPLAKTVRSEMGNVRKSPLRQILYDTPPWRLETDSAVC
jgi:hypothetical protein